MIDPRFIAGQAKRIKNQRLKREMWDSVGDITPAKADEIRHWDLIRPVDTITTQDGKTHKLRF